MRALTRTRRAGSTDTAPVPDRYHAAYRINRGLRGDLAAQGGAGTVHLMRFTRSMTPRLLLAVCTLLFLSAASEPASAATCDLPLAPGDHTIDFTSAGRDRPFLLYVPKSY